MNQYYQALELHKILEMLSKQCGNDISATMALAIEPLTDTEQVREELKKTEAAYTLSIRYGRPEFVRFSDITPLVRRAKSGSVLSIAELLEIRRVLRQFQAIDDWQDEINDEDRENALTHLLMQILPERKLFRRLESAILSEDALADDASPELARIRRKIMQTGLKIRDTLDEMIRSQTTQKYLQESLVTLRDGRYVLPVKAEHKGSVAGLVHDTSATGATLFVEPMRVVDANNEIRILERQEQEEVRRILAELTADCAENENLLLTGLHACVILNLYFAKSEFGIKMNATIPVVASDGVLLLKKARHPLIAPEKVVPVDFALGTDYHALMITGPNTGGKTVVLKTAGLLTAMAMCGLMIPAAEESRVSVFENILVDIGDQQSIEQSLSTFSSHMNSVIEILRQANHSSLVLLDEIGSGTDPVEGAALAVAIIEQLLKQGAEIVASTHYQELKLFAIETQGVQNASCEFDAATLQPTYRLNIGSPGKSNAFAISEKLGLQSGIIENARKRLSEESTRFETVLDSLEKTRTELEESRTAARELERELRKEREDLSAEREAFAKSREAEMSKARREASAVVARVSRESQALMDELLELKKQKDSADFSRQTEEQRRSYKNRMDKLYLSAHPVTKEDSGYRLPRALKQGDSVILNDTGKKATVLTVPDSSGNCYVQAGIMKTKVSVSKLRLCEGNAVTFDGKKLPKQQRKQTVSTAGIQSRATRSVNLELDIRGYAVDEGLYAVDSFLDEAVMNGLASVTIIHGKGTGVLKNAVRDHLKHHRQVKSSRRGLYGEGEDGVTVVELK